MAEKTHNRKQAEIQVQGIVDRVNELTDSLHDGISFTELLKVDEEIRDLCSRSKAIRTEFGGDETLTVPVKKAVDKHVTKLHQIDKGEMGMSCKSVDVLNGQKHTNAKEKIETYAARCKEINHQIDDLFNKADDIKRKENVYTEILMIAAKLETIKRQIDEIVKELGRKDSDVFLAEIILKINDFNQKMIMLIGSRPEKK